MDWSDFFYCESCQMHVDKSCQVIKDNKECCEHCGTEVEE